MLLARIRSWLWAVLAPGRMERDLADELRFHLETRIEDLVRGGLSHAEAARRARLEFGAVERYKEECRESRGLRLIHELRGDLRYVVRGLRKSPGFTFVVVLSLALGIGANTAIFSVVNGVLLRPMPYRDSSRLVSIREEMPDRAFRFLPYLQVLARQDEIRSFEDVLAMQYASYQLIDVPEPEELPGGWVTANLCPFLGVQPAIGRCFTAEDENTRARVTMVTDGLWRRQFGGDSQIIGKSISVRDYEGDKRFTVIGVLPPHFQLVQKLDLLMPMSESRNYRERNSSWTPSVVIARLQSETRIGQARAELLAMQQRLFSKQHEGAGGRKITVLPVAEYLAQTVKTGLLILLGVVGLVLLITCVNVANLILSRGVARLREIAVRASLGAGRARICRQMLTEALTLAVTGGGAGLIAAYWMVRGVKTLAFARLPRIDEIGIDWRVLAFTALISVAGGILFGLLPAMWLSRVDLADVMKSGGAPATGSRRQQKLMNGLVVLEIALCAVAMMGAGLLINTFIRLKGIDPGFDAGRVLVASLSRNSGAQSTAGFYDEVLARVSSIPGVEVAGLTNYPPPFRVRSIQDFRRPGTPDAYGEGGPNANARLVSPGYFQAMRIRILRGRDFDDTDRANSRRSVVISEAMAKHYWAGDDPIGKAIFLREYRKEVMADIVGVVADVRQAGLRDQPEDQMYFSYTQKIDAPGSQSLMVRTAGNPLDLADAVKREVRVVDRNQALRVLTTMEALLGNELAETRFYMIILGVYSGLALLLTALGIGGVVAYSVSRRTREIGVRISFGASRTGLLRMFAADNLKLVIAGLMIGVPASWMVTRYARTLLYEVTPSDPATIVLVMALLGCVSIAVSVGAAFGATGVEPARVLRHE